MTIDEAYRFLEFIARKDRTGSISPDEAMYALNRGSRDYFDFLIGQVEQYRYGKAVPRIGVGMSTKIAKALSPFKVGPATITVTSGIASYPTGYDTLVRVTDTAGKKIERVDDAKLAERLNSVIDPISTASPCFIEAATGLEVYPTALTSIKITYYKEPADMVWANTNGTYTSIGSVQPEWKNQEMTEVLGRAARILGFSFEKQSLVSFGNEVKTTGE